MINKASRSPHETSNPDVASRSPHETSNPDVGCVRYARTRFLFKQPQSQRRVGMCCPRTPFRLPEKCRLLFHELVEQREFGDDASLAAKLMAQLGGQPVLKKDAAPLSDDLDSQTPLRITEFKRDVLGRLIHTLARDNDKVQETAYQYDLDGNLIHRELADGEVQNYFYDLHDQLVKAEIFKKDGTKETWSYTYDALGRRVAKYRVGEDSAKADETRFVWDGSHLLQEQNSDGRYAYIYTDQDSYEPLAQVRDWTTEDGESQQQPHYFHCDQIGIPREMTDKDGNLLWFGNYTGWGRLKEETNVTGTAHQPFRLQNQYFDAETGLHYNLLRFYDSISGRFINQDPIRLFGGENFYHFAFNAQSWIDPLGLEHVESYKRHLKKKVQEREKIYCCRERAVREQNKADNDGKMICGRCGVETIEPKRHEKGVSPPDNEAHVDHIIAKSNGGSGTVENGQVLCRLCNLEKSNKRKL